MILRFTISYLLMAALILTAGGCCYWAALRHDHNWMYAGLALLVVARWKYRQTRIAADIYWHELVRDQARRSRKAWL